MQHTVRCRTKRGSCIDPAKPFYFKGLSWHMAMGWLILIEIKPQYINGSGHDMFRLVLVRLVLVRLVYRLGILFLASDSRSIVKKTARSQRHRDIFARCVRTREPDCGDYRVLPSSDEGARRPIYVRVVEQDGQNYEGNHEYGLGFIPLTFIAVVYGVNYQYLPGLYGAWHILLSGVSRS